jgi:urate oxidase
VNPLVTVMKVDKAPQETYADIGGLDQQVQVNLETKFVDSFFSGGNSSLFSLPGN